MQVLVFGTLLQSTHNNMDANDAKSGGDQVIVLHAIENAQRLNLSRSSPLGLTFASCSMVLRLVSRLRNLAKGQSDTALLRDGSGRFIYLKMQLDDNKILEHIDDSSLGYWMILGYIMIYLGMFPADRVGMLPITCDAWQLENSEAPTATAS